MSASLCARGNVNAKAGRGFAGRSTDEPKFGGQGVSQDVPLSAMWTHLRTLRLADGPDAVHRRQVARAELRKYTQQKM